MTIGGALSALNDLLNADDIPFYYKPSIKAVKDTIQCEKCECEKDVLKIDLTELLNLIEKTGAGKIEGIVTKSEYPGREIYYGIREKREDEQGEDC
jgi:hypothetical protein